MKKTNNKLSLNNIINYSAVVVLTITLLLLVSSKSETAFKLIGYRTYTVLSGSMEPTFYPGDVVIVKNKKKTELKENDIVTFVEDGEVVTHRIVKKDEEGYITKGDNNDVEDSGRLKDENIIGKVSFDIPKLGYIIQFLSKPMVIAAELVLLGVFIIRYNESDEKDKEEKEEEKNEE